ncbi:MAG: integrase core domain-containing protein [bacterium]|nr:integrase core domain-containing protein [bacterium]
MEFFSRQHSKYAGLKGIGALYGDALRYAYMITHKAKVKAKVLIFFEKYGLGATLDAFLHKRSTLYSWQKLWVEGGKKLEALNDKSCVPRIKRKRLWPPEVILEIKKQRREHPNLGGEKLYPLLLPFCITKQLLCLKPRTISNLIHDLGGLRVFPKKVTHFGKTKQANRQKVLRKPKDFTAVYPGHLVALDTIERFVNGCRRYVIAFEDIYTRFSFAWGTQSHASLAAAEFFHLCRQVFPHEYEFLFVLTDNGSEFKKHFSEELRKIHLTHFHTYPKTPKMNAHVERFNRTIQEEFIDYHVSLLKEPDEFNRKLMDYLIFYNTERVHYAFGNKLSPIQFMLAWSNNNQTKLTLESRRGLHYTRS